MTRTVAIALITLSAGAAAGAQSRDELTAVRRCEGELNFVMGRDTNARDPRAALDDRRQQIRQSSRDEYEVSGPGIFSRDDNDRGRAFTYTCRVDVRSGRVDAQYRWSGGGSGSGYDRPDDYPSRPSWDRPGYGNDVPSGRLWQSGGLIGRASGKSIDVVNRSRSDGANVQLWEYGGGDNQKWDIVDLGQGEYAIISQGSNKALTVSGNSFSDGANIVQFRWSGRNGQRWRFERGKNGFYQIVNVASGKCIDVQEAKTANGSNIQQWSCSGGTNQAWKIQK